jgi:pilus assembly protein CpaF
MAGHIISIIGGKGGVGKSQVAANLAFAYAAELRAKVLLLDFDQKSCGDQNIIMGLKSKKNLKELADFTGAIDPRSIQLFTADHKAGVSFIGMPTEPIIANQINEDGLGKALKAMVNIYPITIIDAGSELSPLALKALEFSTLIFIVASPDLLAVNQCKRMYTDLTTLLFPKDMMQILVNQAVNGHPVSPDVIGKQIGKPVFHAIPRDDGNCTAALSRSTPVILGAKNSPFSNGVVDCARKLIQKNVLKSLEKLTKPQDASAKINSGSSGEPGSSSLAEDRKADQWTNLKARIHKGLVEEMDLSKQSDSDPKAKVILTEQTKKLVVELLSKEDTKGVLATREDMNRIVKEILDEALGLGPLESMLANKAISEIMVVGPKKIYYEEGGRVKKSEITFTNDAQVRQVIERIVAPVGRRIDEKTPYVDARLLDGSRVHAIIPPCAIDGCCITIRKFPDKRLNYTDLVKYGSMTEEMADFMRISVEAHRNLVVSGGTGSGKTTLVNVLGAFIQSDERIITCEDSAELNFPQDHVVRLETRPPSLDGGGEIDIRCLVKQTLRMRPTRIVIGECRGGETLDMLQAMNTGHDGSMTTVHSNSPRDAVSRLETLVQYAGAGLPQKAIKEMIASAVHMIVQQSRMDDKSRKVTYITEIGGMQGDVITLQDIFVYKQENMGKDGKLIGKFMATGFIPKFIETLEKKGHKIPRGLFTNKT